MRLEMILTDTEGLKKLLDLVKDPKNSAVGGRSNLDIVPAVPAFTVKAEPAGNYDGNPQYLITVRQEHEPTVKLEEGAGWTPEVGRQNSELQREYMGRLFDLLKEIYRGSVRPE